MGCRLVLIVALTVSAWGFDGAAQTPGSMVEHYRAYTAALERGDDMVAQTEAAAALAAAEASGSPRTGVLATNLARLRAFRLHDLAQAAEPARRAAAAGGVDAPQAQMLVTLTELASASTTGRQAAALGPQIDALSAGTGADKDFLFNVAQAWGYWALQNRRFAVAADAYTRAAALAQQLGQPGQVEYARSLTHLAVSQIFMHEYAKAAALLHDALVILAPLAPERADVPNTTTPAESAYFDAVAWEGAFRSKVASDSLRNIPEFPVVTRPNAEGLAQICGGRLAHASALAYPPKEIADFNIGAVVIRYGVDRDGRLHDIRLAAVAPARPLLAEAVLKAALQMRHEWVEDSPGCRRESNDRYTPFLFRLE